MDRSGNDNRNRSNVGASDRGCRFAFAYGGNDCRDNLFGFVRFGSFGFEVLVDSAVAIDVGRAQVGAAKIDGTGELII